MQVHLHNLGQQTGPHTVDQLNHLIRTGVIDVPSAMAWYEGLPDWIPCHQVPGIQLPARTGSAVPPAIPPYLASSTQPPQPADGGFVTTLIPRRNPQALTSYYLGVFSLIPVLGFFLGILAITFGILGWKRWKRTPSVKGAAHAVVGIVLGGIVVLLHVLIVVVPLLMGK